MTIEEIKAESAKLKAEIELSLANFQHSTGETPIVTITSNEKITQCELMVYQTANILIKLS